MFESEIMTEANPTAESGASTLERLENYLAASEGDAQEPINNQEAPPKEAEYESAPEETPAIEAEQEPDDDAHDTNQEPQLSISDLAKYLGIEESALDVSDDGAVLVKTKIDGKEGAAKFQDLVKSYQIQGHADQKARVAAEKEKAVLQREQQFEAYERQQAHVLNQLAEIATQELVGEANAIDWNALAHGDPALYVQKQHEFNQRQARVNALRQQVAGIQAKHQALEQQREDLSFAREAERLPSLIPEWSDTKVANAEKAKITQWALKSGFSEYDVKNITRADLVAVLRKAMLYDEGKQATSVTEKKVREAPKLVKPGQSSSAQQRAQDDLRSLKQQVRKSGGRQGIAEYLMASGKV